jgi:hypothetical protein
MTRLSYTRALDNLLFPLGFTREKSFWSRVTGEILEQFDLQKDWVDGAVTVNLWVKNIETERIVKTIPCKHTMGVLQSGKRLGRIIDGPEGGNRWWKNDPGGPVEVARLVRDHGLPWFSKVTTLEDQARHWYSGARGTWKNGNLAALVVTLCRLGKLDEALALFDEPIPRTAFPVTIESARCVQRWLEDQKRLNTQLKGQA